MSKKQVILLSLLVAGPAIGLLISLVMGAMDQDGGNMFSGFMTVIVALTGLLVLGLALSPFALMAFYPAEGFASFAPAPEGTPPGPGAQSDDDDDDDDEMLADEGDDDFDSGGDEELFDDGYDEEEFDDDLGDFEEDEDWK